MTATPVTVTPVTPVTPPTDSLLSHRDSLVAVAFFRFVESRETMMITMNE